MSPFKFNLILYIFNITFDVLLSIEQQFSREMRSCSMSNHIGASEVIIEDMLVQSLTHCYIKCSESAQCGAFMFDRQIKMCYLVDKDYKVCDENLGVYEMMTSDFCYNGGTLLNEIQCSCEEGFGGRFCKSDAYRLNDCEDITCQNGGTCVDLFDFLYDFRCECPYPFHGVNCESTASNIALNQQVITSGFNSHQPGSFAVDGNLNSVGTNCAHSAPAYNNDPWLTVDFGVMRHVMGVDIVNRGECCGDRLSDFETYAIVDNANPMESTDKQLCSAHAGAVAQGATVTLICPSHLIGRYFSIVIPGPDKILTICEVMVYGY